MKPATPPITRSVIAIIITTAIICLFNWLNWQNHIILGVGLISLAGVGVAASSVITDFSAIWHYSESQHTNLWSKKECAGLLARSIEDQKMADEIKLFAFHSPLAAFGAFLGSIPLLIRNGFQSSSGIHFHPYVPASGPFLFSELTDSMALCLLVSLTGLMFFPYKYFFKLTTRLRRQFRAVYAGQVLIVAAIVYLFGQQ